MSLIVLPPGISLDDPRPIAARARYTFELPFPVELEALKPGDGIKAIFRQDGGGLKYDAERMWVLIERIADGVVFGTLDSEPIDMPLIQCGDRVTMPLTHAIATDFRNGNLRPETPPRRNYWGRCYVDDCILEGRCHVDYLYREEPDPETEGDEFPDSGWRFRGTNDAIAEDANVGKSFRYVAVGAVLNKDDTWLPLIDSAPGSAFQWNEASRCYIECD